MLLRPNSSLEQPKNVGWLQCNINNSAHSLPPTPTFPQAHTTQAPPDPPNLLTRTKKSRNRTPVGEEMGNLRG
jgi:hypothetical protein